MELTIMENSKKDIAYLLAKHKAEKLRRFYTHCIIYVVFNIIIMIIKVMHSLEKGASYEDAFLNYNTFTTPAIWGLVLAIHAFSVYGPNVILGRAWEEKKLKQYIKEEEEQISNQ